MQKALSLSSAGQYLVFVSSDPSNDQRGANRINSFWIVWWFESIQSEKASFSDCVIFSDWNCVVVRIHPKWLCIYGFVNNFWTERNFERFREVCGSPNPYTDFARFEKYMKKCISVVRIRLQARKARNASTKFRKTLESKKTEKSLEISVFLVFSTRHLNWRVIMAGIVGLEPTKCKSQSLVP